MVPLELARLLEATDATAQEAAWKTFAETHSRLLLHTARKLGRDYDAVMDAYGHVLEQLRRDNCHRLRAYVDDSRSSFTAWLPASPRDFASITSDTSMGVNKGVEGSTLRRLVLSLLMLIAPISIAAQQVTGNIQGRVLGLEGQALPDVQIIVASPDLQGERSTRSDARGRFVLQALPVGSYTVSIRHTGYGPVRVQDVSVRLGGTTSLRDVHLEPQAVAVAEVVVFGTKPVIDPVSASSGARLDSSHFLSLPSQRDFRALLPFVPQASPSPYVGDGVNIGGSTGLENAFYVDGMNVTVDRGTSMAFPFNFVKEIQVMTGGYDAEYGRALSGVINVVTPSGSNTFHGQALGFFTSGELSTAPKVGAGEPNPAGFSQYDVGASLSGPISRDRLWYYVAYDPMVAAQRVALPALPTQHDTQVHHLLAGKLTWRADPSTDVTVTVLGDPYTRDGVSDWALPPTNLATVLLRETGGGTAVAAQGRHRMGSGTEFDVAVSRVQRHHDYLPRSGDTSLAAITNITDYSALTSSGGLGGYQVEDESRTAIRLALTQSLGRHALKAGAEYEIHDYSDQFNFSLVTRDSRGMYSWFQTQTFGTAKLRNQVPTLYTEDAWEATPRLRVNAGLRWEAQRLTGLAGPARSIANEVAPRVGVVYEPGELGSQRLFVSAGRFFEQVTPFAAVYWNGSWVQQLRDYPQNPLVDSSNVIVRYQALYPSGTPATSDLYGQYYDQFGVGCERRLGATFKIAARGSYRILRWVLEDGFVSGDVTQYRMGNPGRGPLASMPRAEQRYIALELSLERSTPGPLYLLASYVLSRNVGNYTGLYATDLQAPLPNSGPQYDFPDVMVDAHGLLPNDRTHVAKLAGSYRFGVGATVGGFLTVASGTPLNEYGTSAYDQGQGTYWTFVRPRGTAGRTPAVWSLDLHGAYDLPLQRSGQLRPRLLLDVFNVGSPRQAVLYDQTHYLSNDRTQVNPTYGAVTQYQPPMSARVGMVLEF